MTKKKNIEDYFDFSKRPDATYNSSVVVGRDDTRGMSEVITSPQSVQAPVYTAPAEDYHDFSKRPPATYGSSVVVGRDDTRGMSGVISAPQGVAFPTWVNPNAAKSPDMYSQAVALDGREPASIPMEYTAPMNADQRVLAQLQALNGGTTPAIDPTVRVPDQVVNGLYPQAAIQNNFPAGPPPTADSQGTFIKPFDPAFIDLTPNPSPPYTTQPQATLANVLRDSAGSPVTTRNGNPIGLPNQSRGNVAGGKGGAGGK